MGLFNLSKFATEYIKDGEVYGVIVSGYRETEPGKKRFADIWIPTADNNAKITKRPDGGFVLSVRLIAVRKVVKGAGEEAAQEKKEMKKKNAPKVEDDDGENPF